MIIIFLIPWILSIYLLNKLKKIKIVYNTIYNKYLIDETVYFIKNNNWKYPEILAGLLTIPAIGFIYIYMNGLRKTGGEVFGGKIWWNTLRPVHATLYLLTAILVYRKNKNAYLLIIADTIIGLMAFTIYHLMN